jgi:hypothetical protein
MAELIDNQRWPLNTILVSQQHNLLYTPVAKNANTTLKRLFIRLSGHSQSPEILKRGKVHIFLASERTGLSLGDYSREEATSIFHNKDNFRFIMLRNPLPRCVSGYLDKFVLHPPEKGEAGEPPIVIGDAIEWVYGQRNESVDYEKSISFEEFVEYLSQNDDDKLDTHFKSQEAYFYRQNFDFIGAIEKMDKLINVLESKLRRNIRSELEHKNRIINKKPFWRRRNMQKLLPEEIRSRGKLPHSSELLTARIEAKLRNRYEKDFERWNEAMK